MVEPMPSPATLRQSLAQIGFLFNPLLVVAWAGTVGFQVAAVYLPMLLTGKAAKWLRTRSINPTPASADARIENVDA
jgi:hypothetical protein